jgi:hypothetical protein
MALSNHRQTSPASLLSHVLSNRLTQFGKTFARNSLPQRPGLVSGILLIAMLSSCGSSSNASTGSNSSNGHIQLSIMVGGLSKQVYLPNMLAQRLGYFAQQGLTVTLIDEASGQSAEYVYRCDATGQNRRGHDDRTNHFSPHSEWGRQTPG